METVTFTLEKGPAPILRDAARRLTAEAMGKAHKPRDPLQTEAFDRDETGETTVETVAGCGVAFDHRTH